MIKAPRPETFFYVVDPVLAVIKQRMKRISKERRTAIRCIVKLAIFWYLVVVGTVSIGILALAFYAANLLDVKLIVSLSILEIPLAIGLSYILGERKRNKLQDAVERVRTARELAHLRVHRFGNPTLMAWYYLENTRTKRAYDASESFVTLARDDLLDIVEHKSKDEMVKHFELNGITLEDRHPKPSEIT